VRGVDKPSPLNARLARDALRAIAGGIAAILAVAAGVVVTLLNGSEAESPWSWSSEFLYLVLLLLWLIACVRFARRAGDRRTSLRSSAAVIALVSLAGWMLILLLAVNHPT
jgi:hypothetical protein